MGFFKTNVRQVFINAVAEIYGESMDVITREQINYACRKANITFPAWFTKPQYKTGARGEYDFDKMLEEQKAHCASMGFPYPPEDDSAPETPAVLDAILENDPVEAPIPNPEKFGMPPLPPQPPVEQVAEIITKETYIPEVDSTFIPFGYASKLKKILQSNVFLPVFISGLSGNGKTFIVEQLCAKLGREFINAPITIETTEDDLLGGFRLVNGETVWSNGPVVEAMERGAVVLLDEIDLASHKIMCLQSIIDGKGVFLKKIGKYVKPEKGFMVVASANTKGKGKWKGQFVGTNILNEAFLERFGVLFEQNYPSPAIERKIITANLRKHTDGVRSQEAREFILLLVEWANQIRRQFDEDNLTEVISTRRLIHIIKYYTIFEDKLDSVKEGTNRFSDDNKEAFTELYAGMDGDINLINTLEVWASAAPVDTVNVAF